MSRQPSGLIRTANSRYALTLRSAIAPKSLTFARPTMSRSLAAELVGLVQFTHAASENWRKQVYCKVVGVSITPMTMWKPCVRGGYERKSRDMREGHE